MVFDHHTVNRELNQILKNFIPLKKFNLIFFFFFTSFYLLFSYFSLWKMASSVLMATRASARVTSTLSRTWAQGYRRFTNIVLHTATSLGVPNEDQTH